MRLSVPREFYIAPSDIKTPSASLPEEVAIAYLSGRENGRFVYKCFQGKAAKPVRHFIARDEMAARDAIAAFYAAVEKSMAIKLEWKEARKVERTKAKADFKGQPGSVFVQSWGWEQTQVDAFQMVRRLSPSKIEAVKIGTEFTSATGPMSDEVKPAPLPQEEAEARAEKIVMTITSPASVRVPGTQGYSWGSDASLWDGKRAFHRSWYA